MQHLFRSNEYQRACELYEDMLVNRIKPDTVATMDLVAGLIRHNHVSVAWEIFRNMKEKGIMVTQKLYSVFIRELCRASKTNEAFELLSEMWNSKINIGDGIFHLVISSLDKKGELEKAEKVKGMSRATKLCTQQDESIGLPATHQSLCGGSDMVFNAYEPQQLGQSVNSNQLRLCRTNAHLVQSLPEVYSNHNLQEVCNILSSSMKWCLMQEALEKCKIKFTPELVLEVLHKCQKHGYVALHFFSWVGQQPG
uniref:Pentatricopeptide repeat-containing protein n=1 Tax=Nelumbo nucifera TaxID=4432 RepID=A0A822ZSS5_NELNU|nr:TPA_asm: hypothetical protein HUJ06_018229 [Nelumbo nucifera]